MKVEPEDPEDPVCGPGYHQNIYGICVPDEVQVDNECNPGYHKDSNGVCVLDDDGFVDIPELPKAIVKCNRLRVFEGKSFGRYYSAHDALTPYAWAYAENYSNVLAWMKANRAIISSDNFHYHPPRLFQYFIRQVVDVDLKSQISQEFDMFWRINNSKFAEISTDSDWTFNGVGDVLLTNVYLDVVYEPWLEFCWIDNWRGKPLVSLTAGVYRSYYGYSTVEVVRMYVPLVVPPEIEKNWEDKLKPDPDPITPTEPWVDNPSFPDEPVTDPTGTVDHIDQILPNQALVMNNPDFPNETVVSRDVFEIWFKSKYKDTPFNLIPKGYRYIMYETDPRTFTIVNTDRVDENVVKQYLPGFPIMTF